MSNYYGAQQALANVLQSQTNQVLVAAQTGKVIRVVAAWVVAADTVTTVVFNSKSITVTTAISPVLNAAADGGVCMPYCPPGWFQTATGEGLTITTGAGSTVGIIVVYVVVNP